MNPVLILTHNNLALTKRCIWSLHQQDVPSFWYCVDNGSSDGTDGWLMDDMNVACQLLPRNRGVSYGWNCGLNTLFNRTKCDHVLCVGNDTWIPPSFYRTLIACELPFVTGVAVDNMEQANQHPEVVPLEPRPDFSAFLIRRDCWNQVGPFDERMKHYASDCDFHIRAHRMGIELYKASVPFYHERSSTLRLAPADEQKEILEQAHKDREMFKSIYGCVPGSKEYEDLFKCTTQQWNSQGSSLPSTNR